MRFHTTWWISTLLMLGLPACGASRSAPQPPPASPAVSPAGEEEAAALSSEEIEAIYRERLEAARTRYTEADVHFMTGMIHHHAQAIEMSRMAPENRASPSIRTLAARIINAQQDEIRIMQRWLEDRGEPVPEVHPSESGGMLHGPGHGEMHGMHGMLSPEQLQELAEAEGREFDRIFLTYMIEHHRGAVTMVRELFATDGAGQDEEVFRFASDVQVDQATEVARMEQMLSALSSEDDPS